MKNKGFTFTHLLLVMVIIAAICLAAALGLHILSFSTFVQAPVIQNEGLILPTISGDASSEVVYIYHQGSRRLNPVTIEHWKKLDGVIKVKEEDYCVEITRSPNFEWEQIFHPEHYIPGWEWKKD
jgi:hypothetical protein